MSKIYEDVAQKSSLSNDVLNQFAEQNNIFFKSINNDIEDITSHEAVDILSLLIYSNKYFKSESEWERLVYCCLDKIRDGIYNNEFNSISAFSGLTYVNFIVRELTLKVLDLKKFMKSLDYLLNNTVYSYLRLPEGSRFYSENSFELMTGLSGVLRYCLDNDNDEQYSLLTNDIVNTFVKNIHPKIVLGYTVPGCHYYPSRIESKYMDTPAINGCINYSLSHGMGGPLCALSLAHKKCGYSKEIIEIIEKLILEYLDSYYYVNNIAYWPGRITFEQYIGQKKINFLPNRMSWCYGSVGILYALYVAGKEFSNEKINEFSLNEMEKIAGLDTSQYLLNSPIVCHGISGVALIMRKMYNDTQNNIFAQKVSELTDYLIYNFTYKDIENSSLSDLNKIPMYDYLEGYTGILQTIYSLVNNMNNVNEKRLLIL